MDWIVDHLGLVLVGLFMAVGLVIWWAIQSESDAKAACIEEGRAWVKTGQHYQPPTYVKSGNVRVPVGGGMVDDYGCRDAA